MLNISKRPQWYTVSGGSREYIKRLTASFADKIMLNCAATQISQNNDYTWTIHDTHDGFETFDQVIFACHADEALAMLNQPTPEQQKLLGAFRYQTNNIIVHSDSSFMPKNKKCWSSWTYLSEQKQDDKPSVSLSYWMNNLQSLPTETPVLVTLNPDRMPNTAAIFDNTQFKHPIFDVATLKAQEKIDNIQGQNGLWFCGAYQQFGFHEDGLLSAVNIVKQMGVPIPWE